MHIQAFERTSSSYISYITKSYSKIVDLSLEIAKDFTELFFANLD